MLQAPDPTAHYSVHISLAELSAHNYGVAEMLLKAPKAVCAGRARLGALPTLPCPCLLPPSHAP